MKLVKGNGRKPLKGKEMASRRYDGWLKKGKWGDTVEMEECTRISSDKILEKKAYEILLL